MEEFSYSFIFIGNGIFVTLQLLVAGISIGAFLGLLLAVANYKGIARFFINRYVSVLRGTPLILQLSFIYFALPGLTGFSLSVVASGIIAFGLNSSAYLAEIFRAGIDSIPKGQFEAAQTLRVSHYAMWKDIILPQVVKNILPAMTNEVITLLKETALISTIGGMDIMRSSQTVAAEQFTYFIPLCIAGLYYYMLVLLIEYVGKIIERKVDYANS